MSSNSDEEIGTDTRVSDHLGEKLQAIRKLHGLSQRELARRAEMTNSTLSMIEQGKVSPSVSSLEKILNAFPLTLQEFFAEKLDAFPPVLRAKDFLEIKKGTISSRVMPIQNTHINGLSLALQRFPEASQTDFDWMISNGFIGGIIISGSLLLTLDGKDFQLNEGDGFHFSIHRQFRLHNASKTECQLVSIAFTEQN